MDVNIDDSYFEPESPKEQTSDTPPNLEIKDKENYRAKTCELGWFLAIEEGGSSSVSVLSVNSAADSSSKLPNKRCSDDKFMLLKYKADLYYSLKDFVSAAPLFEQVLQLLPPLNAMVKREITDSLARCYSQLGEHCRAKEIAKQLVLPPHGSDASSWRLLAQCEKNTGELEDHIISLQKSVALERQHGDFWLTLAEGYKLLGETYICTGVLESTSQAGGGDCGGRDDDGGDGGGDRCDDSEESNDCGSHGSGGEGGNGDGDGDGGESGDSDGGGGEDTAVKWAMSQQLARILSNTVSLFRPYFSWRCLISKPSKGTREDSPLLEEPASHCSEQKETYEGGVETDHSELGLTSCNRDCPFFSDPSITPRSCSRYAVMAELVTPNTNLCLLHSPFVILASRQITVDEFLELLKSVTRPKAITLLRSVCTLAECSCYLWARQLLLYSVRYSNSFAQVAMTTKLHQLEGRLSSFDLRTVKFLSNHFSQRTVFEHSSKHSS